MCLQTASDYRWRFVVESDLQSAANGSKMLVDDSYSHSVGGMPLYGNYRKYERKHPNDERLVLASCVLLVLNVHRIAHVPNRAHWSCS